MEGGISQELEAATAQARFDRRAIPAVASETRWQAGDGHSIRRIDWPGAGVAPKGSILFLPGRGDHYEKYLETLQHWNDRGWRVTASDWRGQAGSGRLGKDAVTGHIDDFSTWVDDLAGFWEAWQQETPGPHVLIGHSMGGHLALRAVADGRVDPDGLVLSAPMLDFFGQPLPMGMMHGVARAMVSLGDPARPAWKWSEKPGQMPQSRANLLTHDAERYQDEVWWREHRPELVMGPGSWGWVERAYASMRHLREPGLLEAVATPVLMIATAHDRLVGMAGIDEAMERLPNARLILFGKESHHEILREVDRVRDRALAAIDTFLDEMPSPE